ncbi:MAG: preprotein translocase subunit YajC [Gammaproteobacteria bacterium]
MSFFIQNAYAAGDAAAKPGSSPIFFYVMIAVLIAVFWFFLIRPQQKKQKEHQKMLSAIGKGDEVITSGGVLGRVKELGDQFITLEVAQGVEMQVQRQAIGALVPKGTLKHV